MFIEILVATLIGISFGIITGLTPGIHINLVSILILNLSPVLLQYTTPLVLAVLIVAMSITHSFLDTIPSIFLGAPDASTVLNVLPGHKLLLEGKGFDAVRLTIMGSLGALILAVILVPLMIPLVGKFYPLIQKYIGFILICIISFMILKDKNRHQNLLVFLTSGCLGLAVLSMPNFKDPLFPMLSGLFGVSLLIVSLRDKIKIPEQDLSETINVPKFTVIKALFSSTFAGALIATLPSLGPAQGAIIVTQFTRKLGAFGFLILVGGINTVNFALSLVTLFVLDKARNGSIIVVSKILENLTMNDLIMFIGVALVAGGASTFLTLKISKMFSRIIVKVNYGILAVCIIIFISTLVFYFNSWLGLLVLFVSTMVGIIPNELDIGRNHAMGCLMLPVILYFML